MPSRRRDPSGCPVCRLLMDQVASLKDALAKAQDMGTGFRDALLESQRACTMLVNQCNSLQMEVRILRTGGPSAGMASEQGLGADFGGAPRRFPRPIRLAPEGIRLLELSEKGEVDAMVELANQLLDGTGGVKDQSAALAICDYIITLKVGGAQLCKIGESLEKRGLAKEALRFFRLIVEVESDRDRLLEVAAGLGGSREKSEIALAIYRKAGAWLQVARHLRNGTGVAADPVEAAKCYWKAVDGGDVEAALELGLWFGERGAMAEARRALSTCGLDVMVPWRERLVRLYRADGNVDAAKFHAACDGKAPTLMMLMTSRNSIFGGFTPVPWESSGGWKQNSDTFAFILRSPKVTEPKRLGLARTQHAVYHALSRGPFVGDIFVHEGSPGKNVIYPGGKFSGVPDGSFFDGTADGKFEIRWLEVWQLV